MFVRIASLRLAFARLLLAGSLAVLAACDSAEDRAQYHYQRGVELVAAGDPVKASLEFRNSLKLKGNFVPALYALGQIEEQQRRLDSAVRLFLGVTELASDHLDARLHLAQILLAAGQIDGALKFADQAYALASSDPRVLAVKAAVALKLDNRGDAVRFADAALRIDASNMNALIVRASERLLASDPKGALAFLNRSASDSQANVGLQLFKIAALEALEDHDGIEQVLIKLAEHHPTNAAFRNSLVRWYFEHGRKADAEAVLRKFAADNPTNVEAELSVLAFIKKEHGIDAARAELRSRIEKGGEVFPYKLALAELSLEEGKYADAVGLMEGLIAERSGTPEGHAARVRLARMQMAKGEGTEAEKLVDQVLAEDSNNVEALTVRATILLAGGRTTEAIDDLRLALNQAPQSANILQLLAEAHERSGARELAEEHFAKAVAADQFRSELGLRFVRFLLRYGKSEQAERVLNEIRAHAPRNREVLALLAQLRLNRGDWLKAQEVATAVRELGDDQAEGLADQILAAALSGQGKYDESIEILRAARPGAADHDAPAAALVQTYVRAGQPEKAEEFLKSALKSDPGNALMQVLLGSVYLLTNRGDEAKAAYQSAIKADPAAVAGHQALAEFHMKMNRPQEAEKVIRGALEQHGDKEALRLLLALVLEASGKYDAAIAEYEALLSRDPRSTIVANNLASLLADHRGDKPSLERAHLLASRFASSEVPQFLDTLGWIHCLRGEYEKAVTPLRSAAEELPDVQAIQYHLGMTYKGLGEKRLAIASLDKAIALPPAQGLDLREKARAARDQLLATANSLTNTNQPGG